jgi:IgGFc binding protein
MNRLRTSHRVAAAVAGVALVATCTGACGDDRDKFRDPTGVFDTPDASPDAPDCRFQCSLDGRSIIENCSGRVIETCAEGLACGAAKCQEPCAAAAADRSSNGCDFYFQEPLFTKKLPPSCYAAYVVNTSQQDVEVELERGEETLDLSRAMFRTEPGSAVLIQHTGPIAPGESVILFLSDASPEIPRTPTFNFSYIACPTGVLPATLNETYKGGTGIGQSFHLKTSAPVAMTSIYPFGGASSFVPSATLVLPVATWAKEHILVNGWEAGPWGGPGAQILASEDDTEVTIIPTRDIQDGIGVKGGRARQPTKYRLGKGEHLQLVQDEELTGSIVSSTKPTTIVGGHSCADIPATAEACDVLAQQIPAFEQWGSEYVGVAYRPRLGNEHEPVPYRIVAARDGTILDYDPEIPPGAPTSMNAGEVALFHAGTGDAFVVRSQDAEHPIYVAAHMTGGAGDGRSAQSLGGRGDPEFVNVVPAGQYLNSYSFYADPTYSETSLVVVRSKLRGELKDVWLECAGNLTGWKPVGTRGDFEYVRVDLARKGGPGDTFGKSVCQNGLQRMHSDGPFTATLWGWDLYASYAYPGGMAQRKLVDTPLVPVN